MIIMTYKSSIFLVFTLGLLAGCTSPPTPAMEWSCRNITAEISCQEGICNVALDGDFTPMELTLDADGGLSLCAYSGCWSGKAEKVSTAGNYFSVIGLGLPWSGTDGAPADISATLNMKTMVATVLTDDYAHPMTCKVTYKNSKQ